jgi:hypothetical protein
MYVIIHMKKNGRYDIYFQYTDSYLFKKMLKFFVFILKDICTQSAGAPVHPRKRQG